MARHKRQIQELSFQHIINKDVISSVKPSSPVYEQPDSSEYEYPASFHAHHPHLNVHQPKTDKIEDGASNSYFTPYVRSPGDENEDDSLRYQSLIHHGGERNEEDDVTGDKGKEDQMPYVIVLEDTNSSGQNSLSTDRKQRNILTHKSPEGQKEQYTADNAETKKTGKADVVASEEYFTSLVRLPGKICGDSLPYQSLIRREKGIEDTKKKGE